MEIAVDGSVEGIVLAAQLAQIKAATFYVA